MKSIYTRRAAFCSVLAMIALATAACANSNRDAINPTVPTTAVRESEPPGQPTEIDSVSRDRSDYAWPSDMSDAAQSWSGLMMAGLEFPLFSDVVTMAEANTVVVVGRRVGVGPSIELGGDPDNNEVASSFSVVVEVLDVVRSQADQFQLQALAVGDLITVIVNRRPRSEAIDDPALLFLRQPGDDRWYKQVDPTDVPAEHRGYYTKNLASWEEFRAGKYELMTSQSVLVGDTMTTVNPMRDSADDPLASDIEGIPIAEIVERIRRAER